MECVLPRPLCGSFGVSESRGGIPKAWGTVLWKVQSGAKDGRGWFFSCDSEKDGMRKGLEDFEEVLRMRFEGFSRLDGFVFVLQRFAVMLDLSQDVTEAAQVGSGKRTVYVLGNEDLTTFTYSTDDNASGDSNLVATLTLKADTGDKSFKADDITKVVLNKQDTAGVKLSSSGEIEVSGMDTTTPITIGDATITTATAFQTGDVKQPYAYDPQTFIKPIGEGTIHVTLGKGKTAGVNGVIFSNTNTTDTDISADITDALAITNLSPGGAVIPPRYHTISIDGVIYKAKPDKDATLICATDDKGENKKYVFCDGELGEIGITTVDTIDYGAVTNGVYNIFGTLKVTNAGNDGMRFFMSTPSESDPEYSFGIMGFSAGEAATFTIDGKTYSYSRTEDTVLVIWEGEVNKYRITNSQVGEISFGVPTKSEFEGYKKDEPDCPVNDICFEKIDVVQFNKDAKTATFGILNTAEPVDIYSSDGTQIGTVANDDDVYTISLTSDAEANGVFDYSALSGKKIVIKGDGTHGTVGTSVFTDGTNRFTTEAYCSSEGNFVIGTDGSVTAPGAVTVVSGNITLATNQNASFATDADDNDSVTYAENLDLSTPPTVTFKNGSVKITEAGTANTTATKVTKAGVVSGLDVGGTAEFAGLAQNAEVSINGTTYALANNTTGATFRIGSSGVCLTVGTVSLEQNQTIEVGDGLANTTYKAAVNGTVIDYNNGTAKLTAGAITLAKDNGIEVAGKGLVTNNGTAAIAMDKDGNITWTATDGVSFTTKDSSEDTANLHTYKVKNGDLFVYNADSTDVKIYCAGASVTMATNEQDYYGEVVNGTLATGGDIHIAPTATTKAGNHYFNADGIELPDSTGAAVTVNYSKDGADATATIAVLSPLKAKVNLTGVAVTNITGADKNATYVIDGSEFTGEDFKTSVVSGKTLIQGNVTATSSSGSYALADNNSSVKFEKYTPADGETPASGTQLTGVKVTSTELGSVTITEANVSNDTVIRGYGSIEGLDENATVNNGKITARVCEGLNDFSMIVAEDGTISTYGNIVDILL